MRYHHIGIPTAIPQKGEVYLERFRTYVSGFEESTYGIEWMRFEPGCPLPELVKTVPHVAFTVGNLDKAIQGKQVIIPPNSPSTGLRVAFIVENGAPVELMEFQIQQKL